VTLSQAVEYCKERHGSAPLDEGYWSTAEIYRLITARCNEIVSIIGLIEGIDTSITSVDGTASYAFPANYEFIRHIQYDGYPLNLISFQEYEQEKMGNTMPEVSPPGYYAIWNETIIIVPTPSETGKTITIYGDKLHPVIDGIVGSQDTIDIPDILHFRLCDGVLADMYGKDLNTGMYDRYEAKWTKVHMPAFFQYKMLKKYRGGRPSIVDSDSGYQTDYGTL
jgi:hypothetical protein